MSTSGGTRGEVMGSARSVRRVHSVHIIQDLTRDQSWVKKHLSKNFDSALKITTICKAWHHKGRVMKHVFLNHFLWFSRTDPLSILRLLANVMFQCSVAELSWTAEPLCSIFHHNKCHAAESSSERPSSVPGSCKCMVWSPAQEESVL